MVKLVLAKCRVHSTEAYRHLQTLSPRYSVLTVSTERGKNARRIHETKPSLSTAASSFQVPLLRGQPVTRVRRNTLGK